MIQLQGITGRYEKQLLKNGDWYGEEEVSGQRGRIHCTPAGLFINEIYLGPVPKNELIGTELDGVLEPNGTVTLFDCMKYGGQLLTGLPLVRRRRILHQIIEEIDWGHVRMVPNTALLGISMTEMISRGPTILKNLRATYGDSDAWVRVRP